MPVKFLIRKVMRVRLVYNKTVAIVQFFIIVFVMNLASVTLAKIANSLKLTIKLISIISKLKKKLLK